MYYLRLIFRNAMRHRLRSGLTVLGIVVAIVAFGLLRTVVDAWYSGAEAASKSRLITRNAISLVFSMPLAYAGKIRQIDGVKAVSWANWFGGVYVSEKNFFPQFAIHAPTYFDLYPEFVLPPEQLRDFMRDRKGAIVGRRLADTYGFKVGDAVSLRGTIFPGTWEFVVRGIYDGAEKTTDVSQFFFQWDYLNETMRRIAPRRINSVGVFVVTLNAAERAAEVSAAVDATFRNSLAETLTETEQAFQLGFVSMTEAIVVAIRIVSYLVIFIIMAVMANTMAMTVRERMTEYATLKALGFGGSHIAALIFGEAFVIAGCGAAIGIVCTYPLAERFGRATGTLFPSFRVHDETVQLQIACAALIAVVAALVPCWRAARLRIVDGLRNIG
jgi:putative ABC transport system permease protein